MTLWDTLLGRPKSKNQQAATPATSPSDSSQPAPFDPTTVQDVSSFLGEQSGFDPAKLHPLAGLNQDTLDYLALEDTQLSDLPGGRTALPSRNWSDDLCYGTGVTYLTALSVGGAWGLAEGLNRSPSSAAPKLRLNSVLNAVTRRGPFLGNSAGVIAMVYNGFNSTIGHYRGRHDATNSLVAGALSGMLFKSTRGLRPMATSGAMVAGAAGAWTVMKSLVFFATILTNIVLVSQESGIIVRHSLQLRIGQTGAKMAGIALHGSIRRHRSAVEVPGVKNIPSHISTFLYLLHFEFLRVVACFE